MSILPLSLIIIIMMMMMIIKKVEGLLYESICRNMDPQIVPRKESHVHIHLIIICKANSILYPHSDLHVNISILYILSSLFLLGILFAHSFL